MRTKEQVRKVGLFQVDDFHIGPGVGQALGDETADAIVCEGTEELLNGFLGKAAVINFHKDIL